LFDLSDRVLQPLTESLIMRNSRLPIAFISALLCLSLVSPAQAQEPASDKTGPAQSDKQEKPLTPAEQAKADQAELTGYIKELEGLRAEVNKAKGEEKTQKIGELLSRAQTLSNQYIDKFKFDEAGKLIQVVSVIASGSKTGVAEELVATSKQLGRKKNSLNKVNQLVARLNPEKPDPKAAKQIVDIYLFELDAPEKAQEHAAATAEKGLDAKIRLISADPETLTSVNLVELGDFYTAVAKASPAYKEIATERAGKAYHAAIDKGIKDEKVLKRVQAAVGSAASADKEKAPPYQGPTGEVNQALIGFYQRLPANLVQESGAFSAENKKTVAQLARRTFNPGASMTIGGVITGVTVAEGHLKDKAVATIALILEDVTDRKATASVTVPINKNEAGRISAGGQIVLKARLVSADLNNATNVIRMENGTILKYAGDTSEKASAPGKK
jgi:hypothetical protein